MFDSIRKRFAKRYLDGRSLDVRSFLVDDPWPAARHSETLVYRKNLEKTDACKSAHLPICPSGEDGRGSKDPSPRLGTNMDTKHNKEDPAVCSD